MVVTPTLVILCLIIIIPGVAGLLGLFIAQRGDPDGYESELESSYGSETISNEGAEIWENGSVHRCKSTCSGATESS